MNMFIPLQSLNPLSVIKVQSSKNHIVIVIVIFNGMTTQSILGSMMPATYSYSLKCRMLMISSRIVLSDLSLPTFRKYFTQGIINRRAKEFGKYDIIL